MYTLVAHHNLTTLRSAATCTLLVPRARTATGQRSFAVNGPATWNRLLLEPPSPDLSESAFKRALTEDAPVLDRRAPLRHLRDYGAGYKYPDLLTYLLTDLLTSCSNSGSRSLPSSSSFLDVITIIICDYLLSCFLFFSARRIWYSLSLGIRESQSLSALNVISRPTFSVSLSHP